METGLELKYIWYKRDAWTVESGLISERMEDGIYKVWKMGKRKRNNVI
jgi:hypothetical protein